MEYLQVYSMELSSTISNGQLLLHGAETTYSYIISTIISSFGDYYKTIWIMVNGTHVFYLFQPCYEHTYCSISDDIQVNPTIQFFRPMSISSVDVFIYSGKRYSSNEPSLIMPVPFA